MEVLGVRCSSREYSFVVLSGNRQCPQIKEKGRVLFPKTISRPQELKWFMLEIETILKKYNITLISIKGTEGMASRGKPFVARVENEAAIYIAAANNGIKMVYKKVGSTIAKDLGLKGKAKYLVTKLDTSPIPKFNELHKNMQEAILVAWSSFR